MLVFYFKYCSGTKVRLNKRWAYVEAECDIVKEWGTEQNKCSDNVKIVKLRSYLFKFIVGSISSFLWHADIIERKSDIVNNLNNSL